MPIYSAKTGIPKGVSKDTEGPSGRHGSWLNGR